MSRRPGTIPYSTVKKLLPLILGISVVKVTSTAVFPLIMTIGKDIFTGVTVIYGSLMWWTSY